MKRNNENFFLFLSIVIFLFSVAGFCGTFNNLLGFKNLLTGFSVDEGSVNVSVNQNVIVDFTTSSIDWGAGSLDDGVDYATIDTLGNVVDGSWDAVSNGFLIENDGNVNVTVNISSGKDAVSFIGGTSPEYKYNISNVDEDACSSIGEFNLGEFYEIETNSKSICESFSSGSTMRIDLRLVIPSDSTLGSLSDTLTATVEIKV
jgi:hypothetical protein